MHPWLARLRHDLLKPALWPARDLRERLEAKQAPDAADLAALRAGLFALQDDQGAACDARLLWARLLQSAPAGMDRRALESFGAGVDSAMNAVAHAVPVGAAKREARGTAPAVASARVLEEAVLAVLALERLFHALQS